MSPVCLSVCLCVGQSVCLFVCLALLTRVDYQVVAVDDLIAQPALIPTWLVGVQDHQALVGGQNELVAALQDRVACRQDIVAPVVVPLDVGGRLEEAVLVVQLGLLLGHRVRHELAAEGAHSATDAAAAATAHHARQHLLLLLGLVLALLASQQLLEVLSLLDEAVELAGQVHTLAPRHVDVLVLDGTVTDVRRLVRHVLYEVVGAGLLVALG